MAHQTKGKATCKKVNVENTITRGNIISWGLTIVGFAIGYGYLQATVVQNEKQVEKVTIENSALSDKVYDLRTEIRVVNATVQSMDKKLDEYIRIQRSRGQ